MINNDFEHYQRIVQSALKGQVSSQPGLNQFDRLLKGDVSGIQTFVYNIKSEKASKTLKARSWFVKAICDHCIKLIQQKFSGTPTEILYNGGGSFYLFYKSFANEGMELSHARSELNACFSKEEIQVTLSTIEITNLALQENFGLIWRQLQRQSAEDKLQLYQSFPEVFEQKFKPVPYGSWEDLTKKLLEVQDFDQEAIWTEQQGPIGIGGGGVRMLGFNRNFRGGNPVQNNTHGIPVWRNDDLQQHYRNLARQEESDDLPYPGSIIPFNYLARFAGARTGAEKLGVLKLDVDNLGDALNKMHSAGALRQLSIGLQWFFEQYLLEELIANRSFSWHAPTTEEKTPPTAAFKDNLYVIYAGGDDTFIVGAWDAVFEFAHLLHSEWKTFAGDKLTISAGLLLVDSHFPVVRFAELAQESLDMAKSGDKNKICIFGKPLYWDDFGFAREKALLLQQLILRQHEPRSIIERLRRSSDRFREILEKTANGNPELPRLWTLLYSIRNTHNRGVLSELVNVYQQAIIYALKTKRKDLWNTETIPVAIRWAEFLTRNKSESEYE